MTAKVVTIGLIWLAIAAVAGATGAIAALRPPLPQIILVAITAALLLAFWKGTRFRAWTLSLPLRALLVPHAARFVGFYFLALHARGELPYAFAVPAGWGDIAAASGGLALAFVPLKAAWHKKAWLTWNIFGLVDIVFVIATAARLALANPHSMDALFRFPLSLLPTFFVPLIVATHVIVFVRLRPE
jgi:hypothetical protein